MSEGGFLVKFNGRDEFRCYAIAFDYDEWKCTVNEKETRELPKGIETIIIEVESK